MAESNKRVFLGRGGAEGVLYRPLDCGPLPEGGWFHYLPEVLKGAIAEKSPDIARAAMGIDVRTFAATQVFPVVLHVALTTAPAEASQDTLLGEAAIDAVRAVDALLNALADKPPPPSG